MEIVLSCVWTVGNLRDLEICMALQLSQIEQDGLIVIQPDGEVDLYSSPGLRKAILAAVQVAGRGVHVDLSLVAYMDSSGVATLVEGLQGCGRIQKSFSLFRPSPAVMKVLQLARLDSVFEIQEA